MVDTLHDRVYTNTVGIVCMSVHIYIYTHVYAFRAIMRTYIYIYKVYSCMQELYHQQYILMLGSMSMRGPERPNKHKHPTFWFYGPRQGDPT